MSANLVVRQLLARNLTSTSHNSFTAYYYFTDALFEDGAALWQSVSVVGDAGVNHLGYYTCAWRPGGRSIATHGMSWCGWVDGWGGRLGWTVGVDGERSDPFTPLEHPVPAAGRGIRARWTGSEATRIAERGAGGVNEHRGEHRGAGQLIPGAQRGAGQLRPGGRSNEERSSDPTKRPDEATRRCSSHIYTVPSNVGRCALHLRSPRRPHHVALTTNLSPIRSSRRRSG